MPCLDENLVLEICDGTADATATTEAFAHIEHCAPCRELVAQTVQMRALEEDSTIVDVADGGPFSLEPPPSSSHPLRTVGRYILLEMLGRGGMGVVQAAFDPELGRKVALKLARADRPGGREERQRWLREAQAAARLSHPHVVAVYDAGVVDERVFIAMELVDGGTLSAWLREAPRRWEEILELFEQAGRGLGAAHERGLIHRDFKPDNVLVGSDGRARVTDFGLARAGSEAAESVRGRELDPAEGATWTRLTVTGALVGTPAYMSPEQLAGGSIDARSDIFSFCVALYEALYGVRPYRGENLAALRADVEGGRPADPPPGSPRVPARIHRALMSGLRPKREERPDSMAALLHAIGGWRRRARWRPVWIMAAVALVTLPAASMVAVVLDRSTTARTAQPTCEDGGALLASTWNAGRAEALEAAFLASDKPYAAKTWQGARQALDDYAQAWLAQHRDACRATYVRHEQSAELFDLRMACLDARRQELGVLVDLLAQPSADLVARAVEAAHALTPLGGCADASTLHGRAAAPEGSDLRQPTAELARARALHAAGQYDEAVDVATHVGAVAATEGARALEAEALLARGLGEERRGSYDASAASLERASLAAEAARDDPTRTLAASALVRVIGYRLNRPQDAERWAERGTALLERLGSPPALEAEFSFARARLRRASARHVEARDDYERALALRERLLGPEHPAVAEATGELCLELRDTGQFEKALSLCQRARQILSGTLGDDHPAVAEALANQGDLEMRTGRYADALRDHERALAIRQRALGADHLDVSDSLNHLANLRLVRGAYDDALAYYRAALAIGERRWPPGHIELAMAHSNAALAENRLGRHAEARSELEAVLTLLSQTVAPDHVWIAMARIGLAEALIGEGRFAAALETVRAARQSYEKQFGERHPALAWALMVEGEAELGAGAPAPALDHLERARALRAGLARDSNHPRLLFDLARALWERASDDPRALELADDAERAYGELEAPGREGARAVALWRADKKPRARPRR